MFNKPTVFVIGAGASAELNLPIGSALKSRIIQAVSFKSDELGRLKGDEVLRRAISRKFKASEPERMKLFHDAGRILANTMVPHPTVDEALHFWRVRPEIVELGKLAIANEIIKSERDSSLNARHDGPGAYFQNAQKSWLFTFLSMAIASSHQSDISTLFQNVTVVNFNYDRTIEHYLYWAIQNYGSVQPDVAKECVSSLKIIRPYGSIGCLEWQDAKHPLAYAGGSSEADLFEVTANLRTFTEEREAAISEEINKELEQAVLVVFLGFGFHPQNVSLFEPVTGSTRSEIRRVIATALNMAPENFDVLSDRMQSHLGFKPRPILLPKRSADLLNELWPTIAMTVS